MERSNNYNPLLDSLSCPAFLVRDGIIVQVNHAASQKMITEGDMVNTIMGTSLSAYQNYSGGCLYLMLKLTAGACGATVSQANDMHLFCLDESSQEDRMLALVAQQLRAPLHSLFTTVESMSNTESLQKSLYQIHRIVTNMSDYPRYQDQKDARAESVDLCQVFSETVEKASTLIENTGIRLHYTALPQSIIGFADREMLERSVYNLISNAVKFSPKDGIVEAKLTTNGNTLCFSVQDQGAGITPDVLSSIFSRYLRSPCIEDSRHGVGLGMALIRTAAINHGGTVLIDQPESGGTRVSMTISTAPKENSLLRSPIRLPYNDYAGGHDHGLLELCDVLPGASFNEI